MDWAWGQRCGPIQKPVLVALAKHADAKGQCWPSLKRLVWLTEYSERSVQRALADLIAAGIIERQLRRRAAPVYRLCLERRPAQQPEEQEVSVRHPLNGQEVSHSHPLSGQEVTDGHRSSSEGVPFSRPRGDSQSSKGCRTDTLTVQRTAQGNFMDTSVSGRAAQPRAATAQPPVAGEYLEQPGDPPGFASFYRAYPRAKRGPPERARIWFQNAIDGGEEPTALLQQLLDSKAAGWTTREYPGAWTWLTRRASRYQHKRPSSFAAALARRR